MKIFFDLDGTLLDSKARLYHLFQFLVPDSKLTFNDYWNLKKEKVSNIDIIVKYFDYDNDGVSQFLYKWMSLIEAPEWIAYDKPFDGINQFLSNLYLKNDLYIITARQSKDVVLSQLSLMRLDFYFKEILVTQQKIEKYNLIKNSINISNNDWIVGDTGKDILTGKKLGINTAAVLSGFLSENKLRTYSPDIILDNLTLFNPNT